MQLHTAWQFIRIDIWFHLLKTRNYNWYLYQLLKTRNECIFKNALAKFKFYMAQWVSNVCPYVNTDLNAYEEDRNGSGLSAQAEWLLNQYTVSIIKVHLEGNYPSHSTHSRA